MPNKGYPIGTQVWLRDNYPELGPTECAKRLGPPFTTKGLRSWASRYGVKWVRLGKPRPNDQSALMKRLWAEGKITPKSPEVSAEQGKRLSEKLADGSLKHPKGMLGKKQTEKCRETSRNRNREMAANGTHPFQKPRTKEQSMAASKRMQAALKGGNVYSSARRGRRDDLGKTFFRSRWEANYARFLNFLIAQKKVAKWEFEVDTFWFEAVRRGTRSYTPDFKVWALDGSFYYDEVKGWMDPKSKTKLKRMAKYHPTVTVNVVGPKEYREIEKKLGGAIPNWEFP